MHIYEVGMGSDRQRVQAPSAGAAALYYGLYCVNTNNPFMAAVYTEDGQAFDGEMWWMNLMPDSKFAIEVFDRIGDELRLCTLLTEEAI